MNMSQKCYIGHYTYNIDDKGRLVIPQDFRKMLGSQFIVNKGYEHCITLYDSDHWNEVVQKYLNAPSSRSDNRQFNRLFLSSAFAKEFDSQGRINLDDNLIKYAEIEKECVIIGAGHVVEIWSKKNWDDVENGRGILQEISEKFEI